MDSYTEGMSLYRRGRYEEAVRLLAHVIGREDLVGRLARFYRGMSHRAIGIGAMRAGRFDIAERHLRSAAAALGRDADLTAYLSGIYAHTHRYEACAAEMERARTADCDGAAACRKLAQAQWRAGRREQAHITLADGLRRHGDHPALNMQLGLFYAADERFAEARSCLESVVQADCGNPDAHYYLALAAAAEGDVRTSAHALQRAFDLRPGDLLLALQLALTAKACAERGSPLVLRLPEPAPPPAASEMRHLANYVTAENDFIEAFLSLPKSAADGELFGMLAAVTDVALAQHPDYADLHYYRARIHKRLGDVERAEREAHKAVRINGRYVQALLLLADIEARTDRHKEALEHVVRAIECGADWPDVHSLAGEWLIRCGRPREARWHLRRALHLKTTYPRARPAWAAPAA